MGTPGWEIRLLEKYGMGGKNFNSVVCGTRHNPNHHSLKGLVLVLLHMYMDGSVSHVDIVM